MSGRLFSPRAFAYYIFTREALDRYEATGDFRPTVFQHHSSEFRVDWTVPGPGPWVLAVAGPHGEEPRLVQVDLRKTSGVPP